MEEILIPNLKLLFKPLVMYYGEWELGDGLIDIAITKNGKNKFEEFLQRYYYVPLNVIFKDDEIVNTFKIKICSKIGPNGRALFFSKRAFLRNLVGNIDDIIDSNGESAYKDVKKAIRMKKDQYRDVSLNGEESIYYEYVKGDYLSSEFDLDFEDFVELCKKQYTKLLSGYNAVMDLFDKAINTEKFINCFDVDKLYLYTCHCLLEHSKDYYNKFGKTDYNIVFIDNYKSLVQDVRNKDNFYTTSIVVSEGNEKIVYTVDDLFRDYDELMNMINTLD